MDYGGGRGRSVPAVASVQAGERELGLAHFAGGGAGRGLGFGRLGGQRLPGGGFGFVGGVLGGGDAS